MHALICVCQYVRLTVQAITRMLLLPLLALASVWCPVQAQDANGGEKNAAAERPLVKMCPVCSGKGTVIVVKCTACGGTGRCSGCNGAGYKSTSSALRSKVVCLVCRGTGQCKSCNGTGGTREKCSACKGTGQVPRYGGENVKPAEATGEAEKPAPVSVTAPEPSAPSATTERTPISNEELFALTVQHIQKQFEQRAIQVTNFRDALKSRGKLTGKVLQSEVCIFDSNPRGVVAGASESPAPDELGVLLTQDRAVGAAITAFMEGGSSPRKAVVIYGVLGSDSLLLLSIAAPAAASAPPAAP